MFLLHDSGSLAGSLERLEVTQTMESDSHSWELKQQGLETPFLSWLLHSHVWNLGMLEDTFAETVSWKTYTWLL